ncbi:vitellogenin-like [Anticarsia gemmatalis]|uniref:vitellogenin-like n=1 Tax=Anticarsia gemmatalis TaxID=129554 RepID=UPI003F75E2DC
MKLLVLTAIIAVVASNPVTEGQKWPWQVGKVYNYDVNSYTWTKFEQSDYNGNAFKAQFIVRVKAPGRLVAKLDKPLYAQVASQEKPSDLPYQPFLNIDQPFEILVDGGRVLSLNLPASFSVDYQNLIKGLVSALQVDLSTYGHVHEYPNSYDKESFQGLFKKVETDLTGECETLYSVSPISAEWRRELPHFASGEAPVEIVKSKNYGTCNKRVAYYFGIPEGAIWNGIAYENDEKQFIKHTSEARILAGKQGTIFNAEVMDSVYVTPLLFGKQKAEVKSYVKFYLNSVEQDTAAEWQLSEKIVSVNSLLYTLSESTFFPKATEKTVADAQNLLQRITPLLKDPNNLPKSDFLSKFNILSYLLATMSSEQLDQLTASLEVARTSKNVDKYNMWVVYRDAVAQAGSGAAFRQIKSWVLTKKVEGEDAAELIASLASALRYPTNEILEEFFNFAVTAEVQELKFVNTSALLATAKVFRFANHDIFVVDHIIPRFSKDLKAAIEKGDSKKAQVYIRVLGNLAHSEVIQEFVPYLEGKIPVSKFLRIQMIISLKKLANMKNPYVRAVLYSILKNTAEPYEIRVAAALNIFMAFPTADMMRVMAHMTNDDPSTQVRAVLQNGITFASNLKDPRFAKLAKTASAVKDIIATEKYGYRYSTDSMIDMYNGDDEVSFFRELSYIGSEDNILPVYQRGALRSRSTAWTEENSFTLSVSGMQLLMDYITQLFATRGKIEATDFKFSAKKIADLLNIKREPREYLEGSFFLDNWNQETFYTFTEEELQAFIVGSGQNLEKFVTGFNENYVKVLNQKQVMVVFPLAMGVPFVYDYNEPVLFSFAGKVGIENKQDSYVRLNNELTMTYARNFDGRVGFLDTLGNVYATNGIVNKLQMYVPAKVTALLKLGDVKFTFVFPEQDANIIHYSVWPYSSLQKKESLLPISEEPTTKYIERSKKVALPDFKIGSWTGMAYQLKGYSYSSDYSDFLSLFDDDLLKNFYHLVYQKDVALTNFNFKYIAKETKNKALTLSTYFNTAYNVNEAGEMGPAVENNDVQTTNEGRCEKLGKKIAAGIKSANVQAVDISAVFDGQDKTEFVFTAAYANSFVDPKVQAGFFYKGKEQINGVFRITKPKIVPLNFEEALKNDIKVKYEADIKFGSELNVHYEGFGERSEEYTEQLKNDPRGEHCLKDVSNHNLYQQDCYKMVIRAHAPDTFKGKMTYTDLTPSNFDVTFWIYELFKQYYSWEEEENPLKTAAEGTIEIEAKAFYYEAYLNYQFITKYGVLNLKNVEGMYYYPYAMAAYAPITPWERSRNWFTGYQNLPYCAVDNSKIWTFSGRSYDYSLSGSWHVVMVDEANDFAKWNDLVILARRPSENQEEVYISYKIENGKYVEVDIKPNNVEVKSNTKKTCEGALTTYWDDALQAPLLEYYSLAEGIKVFSLHNGRVRIIYDGQRLIIFTDDHRKTTRGVCGQSTTQISDDYMTPWGLVDLPEHYGAAFSLEGEFSDPKTVALKNAAKLKAYQPFTKFTKILHSDAEWSIALNKSVKGL